MKSHSPTLSGPKRGVIITIEKKQTLTSVTTHQHGFRMKSTTGYQIREAYMPGGSLEPRRQKSRAIQSALRSQQTIKY